MNADVIHRLGATVCAAAGGFWLIGAVDAWRRRRRTLRRLAVAVRGGFSGIGRSAAAPTPGAGLGTPTPGAGLVGPTPGAGLVGEDFAAEPGGVTSPPGALRATAPSGPGPGAAGGAAVRRDAVRVGALGEAAGVGAPGFAGRVGPLGDMAGPGALGDMAHGGVTSRGAGRVGSPRSEGTAGSRSERPGRVAVRRWLLAAGAVCAGYALVGGALGGLFGLLCGGGVWWWQGRPMPVEEFDVARAVRELPLAADLLAACIAAGADPVTAARVVGESLEGPVGRRLAWGAAELRLGGEPARAWRRLASVPGARPLARLLERAGDSGAPAAAPVARLAAQARAECGRSATVTARRAAVLITAPVGLCFLPAFITVGVAPILIGLAGGLLGGGGG